MTITLKLTPLQAKGLLALAGEGAEGMLTAGAEDAAAAYIGGPQAIAAAQEAYDLLRNAYYRAIE